jgi:hypothetical protein
MAPITEVIDRVAADALAAPLKEIGYRKSGRIWRRRLESAIQVVQVQASRHNVGAEGQFCLNAGVYFPALARRLPLFPPTDSPSEPDCHLRIRAQPPGRSWWEVRAAGVAVPEPNAGRVLGGIFGWLRRRADRGAPETNERAIVGLRDALQRYALPWLERMADLHAARNEFEREGQLWNAAAASLELGDRELALAFFKRVLKDKPAGADEVTQWGLANGLQ